MINSKIIKNKISQLFALIEISLKLKLRFKFGLILSFITPFIGILMPIIVMGQFLNLNTQFGPWSENNYMIYQFIAYNIGLLIGVTTLFPNRLQQEKYWMTLPALIIGPFNRFYLLFGIFFSHIILVSLPFTIFLILGYLYWPISIFTLLFILGTYFLVALIFSGIGIILGIFSISKENFWKLSVFLLNFLYWLSCITYPFEIFPNIIQSVINLNPFYYIFDFLRLLWIENDIVSSITLHAFNLVTLISCAIILPFIGVFIFNKVYKKYGIVGY